MLCDATINKSYIDAMIAKRILVSGKVQGVFFRKHTSKIGRELNITGWVKNTDNNDVEILAQGEKNAVEQLITWCKQGSPQADVKNVEVKDEQPDITIKHFSIKYNG